MRLFVGIPPSAAAREALERLTLRLRATNDGLRWSSAEQWHITLAFLGSVEQGMMKALVEGLHSVRSSAAPVQMEGIGIFDRAGILYAAVEVTPGLAGLQRSVAAIVRRCGIELEERPYRPHITLARSRNRDGRRTLERLGRGLERRLLSMRWSAKKFFLYESQPTPSGSRYVVQEGFLLDSE